MVLGFTLDPFGAVRKAIKSWRPRNCRTEKDYEDSLVARLEKELKNQKIERQYARGTQRMDIVVHRKVPIEIKKDLKSKATLNNTIGQLEQYLQEWDKIFLIICGEVKRDLLTSLRQYANKQIGGLYPFSQYERVEIIVRK